MAYSRYVLLNIGKTVKEDPRYKIINGTTCVWIRRLSLNGRRTKGGKRQTLCKQQRRIDQLLRLACLANLLQCSTVKPCESIKHSENLKICTINIQSIKSKEQPLLDYIYESDIDICILTESWLNDNDRDYAWLETTDLNKVPFKLSLPTGKTIEVVV